MHIMGNSNTKSDKDTSLCDLTTLYTRMSELSYMKPSETKIVAIIDAVRKLGHSQLLEENSASMWAWYVCNSCGNTVDLLPYKVCYLSLCENCGIIVKDSI